MKILAIETSCDETAAAVIGDANENPKSEIRNPKDSFPVVLSSVVSSQIDLHAKTGGVVPEVASRAHMEAIVPVIAQALLEAKNSKHEARNSKQILNSNDENSKQVSDFDIRISDLYPEASLALQRIDYIAYTAGPGLIGSLLVGYNAAKAIAYARNLPLIPINHIEGHIYSAFGGGNPKSEIRNSKQILNSNAQNSKNLSNFVLRASNLPLIALTVSGGHTSLTLMTDHGKYENLGQTLDDAAGEAFDKVAKLLGLGYPGGPIVSKLASQFREQAQSSNSKCQKEGIIFPRPILNDGTFNFSFSGLKTAVLQKTIDLKKEYGEELPEEIKSEICCAFEDAVVDVLVTKTMRAAEKYQPKSIILAGGVAANQRLRAELALKIVNCKLKIDFLVPEMKYCGDNAAMIGLAAYYHVKRGDISTWDKAILDSNLELS